MKLLFIFGNAAVGKMTVGQELMKITGLRLFHNHMMLEPVLEIFGDKNNNAIPRLRTVILEEFAATQHYGLIVTGMLSFHADYDAPLVPIRKIFEPYNTDFYYVELVTSKEVRLQRNTTENRLRHKASKRDIEASNKRLLNDDKNYCASSDGQITWENYIKIDNTDLSAEAVARIIKERFML